MKRVAAAAVFASLACATAAPPKNGPWQIAPQPVLTPGEIGAWDDFEIRDVSVIRAGKKWLMLYKGVALSDEGRTCGLGLAASDDGVAWKKLFDDAIMSAAPNEEVLSPALARARDSFWAAWVVEPFPTSNEQSDEVGHRIELAASEKGEVWQAQGKISGLDFKIPEQTYLRVSLYAEGDRLHLWWIGNDREGKSVLCHSTSRDAIMWTPPNMQLTSGIDNREIIGARVYPSGDFFLLVYLARPGPNEVRVVTKMSRDAVTWKANGPPEFILPDPRNVAMPEMTFTSEGARLFYSEIRTGKVQRSGVPAQLGAVLGSAFCAKKDYVQ